MSNVLTVPDYIAERIRARQEAGQKSSITSAVVGDGVAFPRISTRSSRYRLIESGVETVIGDKLDVVVVGANPKVSKVFYAEAYSGESQAPSCWSNDGVKPHESVQAPVNDACSTCPHNVLGSKMLPSGAKSKMCADQRHLAVVPAADQNKVYGLTIPVSGMKALREYLKELANYGLSPEEVVTELGFDEQASYPKMTFKHKGFVPQQAIDGVAQLTQHDSVLIATRQMDANPAALPAADVSKKLEQPAPAAAVDEAYEEEVVQEPTPKAASKPKVEPVQASDELAANIANLFDS